MDFVPLSRNFDRVLAAELLGTFVPTADYFCNRAQGSRQVS
jgi:hypothetical protein